MPLILGVLQNRYGSFPQSSINGLWHKFVSWFSRPAEVSVAMASGRPLISVPAFLKKWWVDSDFKAPNLPLSLWLKVSGF
jgi:hypothetical protein